MAQSGYTPILIYGSGTATNVPLAANMTSSASGAELALNYADGKLFYKDSGGVVQVLASKAGNINVSSLSFGTTGLTPSTATTGAITVAGTLITSNGGTGLSSYTAGDLPYYASGTALSKLAIGTNGKILSSSGSAPQWVDLSTLGVNTFSAGTTGLTPSSATSGAITLAGTLNVTNGGTGLTAVTAGYIPYGNSSNALSTSSNLQFNGSQLAIGGTFNTGKQFTVTSPSSTAQSSQFAAATGTYNSAINITNSYIFTLGIEGSAGGQLATGTSAYASVINSTSQPLQLATNNNLRATLDVTGNLGLGVTPSSWSGFRALQIGSTTSLWSGITAGTNTSSFYTNNGYFNGSNRIYLTTGYASEYIMGAGSHYWYSAPSNTAGNIISFNQTGIITQDSNFGIGGVTPSNAQQRIASSYGATPIFQNEFILTLGSPNLGTYKGYILLARAYAGSVGQTASWVNGTFVIKRGGPGSGNRTDVYTVSSNTAYNTEDLLVQVTCSSSPFFTQTVKVTYGSVVYHAIETYATGGNPDDGIWFTGSYANCAPVYVDATYVSSITAYGSSTFIQNSNSKGQYFTLSDNGYLGIGTTTPATPLDVANTNSSSISWQRTGVSAKKWGFVSDNSTTYLSNLTDGIANVIFPNAGGIQFSNSSALTNSTLNDYETGTYTPTLSTSGGNTYTQSGTAIYTKIGNTVLVQGTVTWTAKSGTGGLQISLPFATTTNGSWRGGIAMGTVSGVSVVSSSNMMTLTLDPTSSVFSVRYANNLAGWSPITPANISTSGEIQFSANYTATF